MDTIIEYRGKRITNKGWVYGYYVYDSLSDRHLISFMENRRYKVIEVIPESIGQYIGIKDIDDKKIYTGDITENYEVFMFGDFKYYEDDIKGKIYTEAYGLYLQERGGSMWVVVNEKEQKDKYRIVANTFDNPKIMTGK